MPEKFFGLSVYALIQDRRGRCLILRRSADARNNPGKWDLPGGKTDSGETFDQALRREITEETGLAVSLEHIVGAAENQRPKMTVACLILTARTESAEVRLSHEHDHFEWVSVEELSQHDWCPHLGEIIAAYSRREAK